MGVIDIYQSARAFLRSELRSGRFEISWRRRLWLYWHGFLSSRDRLWGLTDDTADQYLSDLEYRATGRIDAPYREGLRNKLFFQLIAGPSHGHLLPEVYGLVRDGRVVRGVRVGELRSFADLLDLIGDRRVVAKPVRAAKGDGVTVLDGRDGTLSVDGRPVDRSELVDALTRDRDLLVTEYVESADYASTIYPDSTNSIRVLTMVDPSSDEPFVASAVHRFGTDASGHVDNWDAGGISAGVDVDSGELGEAVSLRGDDTGEVRWTRRHPDTGERIAGVAVPGWDRVKATVLDLAATYGGLWPHVGWDLVVEDDQGSVAVLEGEPQSVDPDQQAHGPLLADDRVRRFYEHHGVISPDEDGLPI